MWRLLDLNVAETELWADRITFLVREILFYVFGCSLRIFTTSFSRHFPFSPDVSKCCWGGWMVTLGQGNGAVLRMSAWGGQGGRCCPPLLSPSSSPGPWVPPGCPPLCHPILWVLFLGATWAPLSRILCFMCRISPPFSLIKRKREKKRTRGKQTKIKGEQERSWR